MPLEKSIKSRPWACSKCLRRFAESKMNYSLNEDAGLCLECARLVIEDYVEDRNEFGRSNKVREILVLAEQLKSKAKWLYRE